MLDVFLAVSLVFVDGVAYDVFDVKQQCPDILNNDVGTLVIGTETIIGPSDSLCERTAA